MYKMEAFFKITFIFLGIAALVLYTSEPDRRYDKFLSCTSMHTAADCAVLFGR